MKRKLFCITLALIMLFTAVPFYADAASIVDSGSCGSNATWSLDSDGVLAISGTGAITNWGSSDSSPWYKYRESIKTITIDNGITSIGKYAFAYCQKLSQLTIAESVTSIEDYAFYEIDVNEVRIPANVKHIGEYVFKDTGIEEFIVDSQNQYYSTDSTGALFDKDKKTLIVYPTSKSSDIYIIPNGVETIKSYAFSWSATDNIVIPESVKVIEDYAINHVGKLEFLIIYSKNAYINPHAITGKKPALIRGYLGSTAEAYAKNISVPFGNLDKNGDGNQDAAFSGKCGDNVTWSYYYNGLLLISGTGATYDYSTQTFPDYGKPNPVPWANQTVKQLIIDDGITHIGNNLFERLQITSVSIPNSVTHLGTGAFKECRSLKSVSLSANVAHIGHGAFRDGNALESITVANGNKKYRSVDGVLFTKDMSYLIQYPAGKTNKTYKVPTGVVHIEDFAFSWNPHITSVELPDTVIRLGFGAFRTCTSLLKVVIPPTATDIEISETADSSGLISTAKLFNGSSNVKIHGYAGSAAETYAKNNKIPFVSKNSLNGTNADIGTVHAIQTYPKYNADNVPANFTLNMYFNEKIVEGSGKLQIYSEWYQKPLAEFSAEDIQINDNMFSIPNIVLANSDEFYVLIEPGFVYNENGIPYYGINEKTAWRFYTEENASTKKTKYVNLKYPKSGILVKKDDTTNIPLPNGTNDQYGKELKYWASYYNVDSIANAADINKILNMSVKIPVTDSGGQTFLLDDNATTVKQVMQDLIFIQHFQPYINKIDKWLANTGEDDNDSLNYIKTLYGTEEAVYQHIEKYAAQINEYFKLRSGGKNSSFFLSTVAPLAYKLITSSFTESGSNESKYVKNLAVAHLDESLLESSYKNLQSTADYAAYEQGLDRINIYYKTNKELYRIKTSGGFSGSTVKLGADLFSTYINDTSENATLKELAQAWKDMSKTTSAVKTSVFLGCSLGMFELVVDLNDKITKKFDDKCKAWYFVADYYIQEKYPNLYKYFFEDGVNVRDSIYYGLTDGLSLEIQNAPSAARQEYNYRYKDPILDNWCKMLETGILIKTLSKRIVSCRRDLTNVANIINFVSTVNIEDVKRELLNYISAELNKGKTTEGFGNASPIYVNIYDKQRELVATLSSENENDINTKYGSFYLLGDDKQTKYFILSSDEYSMEIVPYGSGKMTVSLIQKDGDNTILGSSYYKDVDINQGMVFTSDLSAEFPTLNLLQNDTQTEIISEKAQVETISIIPPSSDRVAIGDSISLNAVIYPEYAVDADIIWSVSDNNIAIVDEHGVLTAVSEGQVTIVAKTANKTYDSILLEIYEPITAIDSPDTQIPMVVGETFSPIINIIPLAAADETVCWQSSNNAVVSVDSSGEFEAVGAGSAVVTASAGNVELHFNIVVSEKSLDIVLYQSDTLGDRVKIDLQNMSCNNTLCGDVYVGIYNSLGQLKEIGRIAINLIPSAKKTEYVSISYLDNGSYAKAMFFSKSFAPFQYYSNLNLICKIITN